MSDTIELTEKKIESKTESKNQVKPIVKNSLFLGFFSDNWYNFLTLIGTFFAPVYGLCISITSFIIIDYITGIAAARKRKEKIVSRKMMLSFHKLWASNLIVMLLYWMPSICFGTSLYIPESAAFVILSAHIFSIGENCGILTGSNIFSKIVKNSLGKMVEYMNKKI